MCGMCHVCQIRGQDESPSERPGAALLIKHRPTQTKSKNAERVRPVRDIDSSRVVKTPRVMYKYGNDEMPLQVQWATQSFVF